jgi:citrate synthase
MDSTPKTIADVMTSPAVTAKEHESLEQAGLRMSEHGVGSVVIVDGNRPLGILTERDLVRAAAAGASPREATVGAYMTGSPDCVDPDTEITEAWRSLAAHGYRHFPVVVADELQGIVSLRDLTRLAQIRPVEAAYQDVPRGLEGVVVAETHIGEVRGLEGFYHYRQYSAIDLAEHRPLEDVWYLLFEGELPSAAARADFEDEIRSVRELPGPVMDLLPAITAAHRGSGQLDALRSVLSLVGAAEGMRPSLDLDRVALRRDAMRLCALVPAIVTAVYRLEQGLSPVPPHPTLGYAANYLFMLTGEEPDPVKARAVEQYLVSTIDHGFNASTFTARVVASTGADVAAAVVAAVGALSGPLHGGAPSRALDTLDAIGTPERTAEWVRDTVSQGKKMMGFGHRVYKTEDPRSLLMRRVAESLGGPLVEFAVEVERTVVEVLAELKPGRNLYANVEFYAGVVMELCGIPREMFTPTFATSRVIGWCSHILEQAADNRIIRPSSRYIGPPPPQPVPEIA